MLSYLEIKAFLKTHLSHLQKTRLTNLALDYTKVGPYQVLAIVLPKKGRALPLRLKAFHPNSRPARTIWRKLSSRE